MLPHNSNAIDTYIYITVKIHIIYLQHCSHSQPLLQTKYFVILLLLLHKQFTAEVASTTKLILLYSHCEYTIHSVHIYYLFIIFVGVDPSQMNAPRLLLGNGTIMVTRDVKFNESTFNHIKLF